jgi:hypothetical protein
MGLVHRPGIYASAAAICVCLLGALAVKRLAELAPCLVPGLVRVQVLVLIRLRPDVSHADLLLSARYLHSLAQPSRQAPTQRV